MGVISNTYEEESDIRSHASEPYDSDCVIVMQSLYDRLSPPPPVSGCGHRPSTIYICDTVSARARGNSCDHHCDQPQPDTGQGVDVAERGSKKDICGRLCCPKCGSRGYWNKSRMLRATGHFILFLILASCGGFIVNGGFGHDDPSPDLAEIVESPSLKTIKLQPVPISDLKKQLQHTKNYYDFLRIFLTKKDVSNEVIDDLVNARIIQKILESGGKKAREYDNYDDFEYSDEMPMDAEAEQERLDEELTEAWYHNEEMLSSPLGECKTPKPEIVNVIDHENKNRIYLPECTVVHRCRNVSGCCGSTTRECGPVKIQVIERSFIVMDLFNDEKALPGKDMVEKRLFINHTECGCSEKLGLQSCDKLKCPFPFTMMRPGTQCTCDCKEFANEINYLCQGIKDGLIPLTETDLACIKSGSCLKPVCTRGTLHVQSGHCPLIPVDEIQYAETQLPKEKNRHIRHLKPKGRTLRERELETDDTEMETDIDGDTGSNLGSEIESDVIKEPETKVVPSAEIRIESETKPEVETRIEAVESQVDQIAETQVQTRIETRKGPEVEPEIETQTKTPVKSQEHLEAETQIETEMETQTEPEIERESVTNANTKQNPIENVDADMDENVDADVDENVDADVDENVDADADENVDADVDENVDADADRDIFANVRTNEDANTNKHASIKKNSNHKTKNIRKSKKRKDAARLQPDIQT